MKKLLQIFRLFRGVNLQLFGLFLVLSIVSIVGANAQSTSSTITGNVSDGANPIAEAVVTAVHVPTNTAFYAITNQKGNYVSYKTFMLAQITELIDSYHPGNIWFDGEWEHASCKDGKWTRLTMARTPNVSDPAWLNDKVDDVMEEWWTWEQPEWWAGRNVVSVNGHKAHFGIDPKHRRGLAAADLVGDIEYEGAVHTVVELHVDVDVVALLVDFVDLGCRFGA